MSTWHAPPSPMSRSRSPGRRAYAGGPPPRGYADAAYPPLDDRHPYDRERDWDRDRDFSRQRDWQDYERDRARWGDYGKTRGRSRSPTDDDRHYKRRRSGSPHDRDRFDPRPRYDDYDSPRRSGYSNAQRGGHRGSDPYASDHPVNYRTFCDWLRASEPKQFQEDEAASKDGDRDADGKLVGLKARYDKYKKTLTAQQVEIMFDWHKKHPWFQERYDPQENCKNLRMRVRKEGWEGKINKFVQDLDEGKYDPSLSELDPAPETAPSTSQANGAPVETSPSSAPAVAAVPGDSEMSTVDESLRVDEDMEGEGEVEGEEETNEPVEGESNNATTQTNGKSSGTAPAPGPNEDEISVIPETNQVMIRTIPPDIGRAKLEEALSKMPHFWYLALGDPMQKKNYYRAGWIRFKEGADMEETVKKLGENKVENFKLHVTHSTRPFTTRVRYAPEACNQPDRIERDLGNVKKLATLLEDRAAELATFKPPKPQSPSALPAEGDVKVEEIKPEPDAIEEDAPIEPKERGSEAVERRLERLLADLQEKQENQSSESPLAAKKSQLALDLYIAYVRAAFNCCYYCAAVTDHAEELQRKCVKHVRRTGKGGDTSKDENWMEIFDKRIAVLIDPEGVDPRDYGGKNYDEEVAKAMEPNIQQEDEGKYRCKACQKLFKAAGFVEKHVLNKHPQLINNLDNIHYFNNFALDPHRIQPFQRPPPQIGNGPSLPLAAYGLRAPPEPLGYGRPDYGPPGGHSYPGNYDGGRYGGYHERPYEPAAYHYGYPPPPPYFDRRRSPPPRRLSDRLGDYAPVDHVPMRAGLGPGSDSLPPKPAAAVLMAEPSGGDRDRGDRDGARGGPGRRRPRGDEPPLPPPPGAKDDPRATAGRRVSYHDMDQVAEGDAEVVLNY